MSKDALDLKGCLEDAKAFHVGSCAWDYTWHKDGHHWTEGH
jgi:hypothetical protein